MKKNQREKREIKRETKGLFHNVWLGVGGNRRKAGDMVDRNEHW